MSIAYLKKESALQCHFLRLLVRQEQSKNYTLWGVINLLYVAVQAVKQFYLDVYEALGNLLIIPVALNNVNYRADIEKLASVEKNAVSLEDFIELTKATRFHFCLKNEIYTDFLGVIVNPKLRNAIGHNDVEYNTALQLITYIPTPKDRTKKKTEYLLEFENEAIHMFQGILAISEYIYRLRELELIFDGKIPVTA